MLYSRPAAIFGPSADDLRHRQALKRLVPPGIEPRIEPAFRSPINPLLWCGEIESRGDRRLYIVHLNGRPELAALDLVDLEPRAGDPAAQAEFMSRYRTACSPPN